MQFPVPKNIDLEDKIVGPMTLRQFLYVLVGGTIAYTIFKKIGASGGNMQLALFLAIPIALFSLALAFVKIQERPFADFLVSLFLFLTRPKQRIWKRQEAVQGLMIEKNKVTKEEKVVKQPLNIGDLSELTNVLDGKTDIKSDNNKIT